MFQRRKKDQSYSSSSSTSDIAMPPFLPVRTTSKPSFKSFILILSILLNLYLLFLTWAPSSAPLTSSTLITTLSPTTRRHLLFSVASSSLSWSRRLPYLRLWYSPNSTRAVAFLDKPPPLPLNSSSFSSSPTVLISADTSAFPYTFRGGLRSAIRVARAVKEAVDRNETDVRWFVFGDDDTVFFVDNVVRALARYDHRQWLYVGSNSESYDQNVKYSFEMAFGGGGFAISCSLAKVLARVLDSCLRRYANLYGSDSRIYSCVAELGVSLTHEPGFHQLDMRGNLFGMLAAHPLSPLLSLHHLEAMEPIFPDMDRVQALEHLVAAANVDPARILQQTVCYDQSNSLTFSVSWGFAIQVYQGNELLPDLLSVQRTFVPWRRGSKVNANFMFNTRAYRRDPCKRPSVFFFKSVTSDKRGIWSHYSRDVVGNCFESNVSQVEQIIVFSGKLELNDDQMNAPRRQCCNVLPPSANDTTNLHIRQCEIDELISMQS
ncbi:hypothetical protein VNO80_25093 [Phaseolus coccineus]|uniref:Uncharacterized protein n=1 Tax=Phaseolus coccineus TaxID=3886 RepID=A0AAN9LTN4_PHACN